MLESVTSKALESALDGLSMRQKAIANNIANINTPGYTAERVSFEDALAASVKDGNGSVQATMARSLEPTDENGNNVNLDTETLSNTTTVLQYQFATQAENQVLTSVRAVLKDA
ncbi:flagellar biosynthesis protein FlgB [Frondihabitans sp. PAMC 28766]|uniref:flagellar basal body rod protein FlgB n=1 Tax=Frondihabitans sp. PAMC 28766 TaxID=1795630 RepID=UPI00078B7953|nr:flagellar basal body protein [Frondihabitans sp. PAMC 28766]AMM19701.1 flagellar biosynthesis protein FlgB [Frondihabitans sp. PAMC 28766]